MVLIPTAVVLMVLLRQYPLKPECGRLVLLPPGTAPFQGPGPYHLLPRSPGACLWPALAGEGGLDGPAFFECATRANEWSEIETTRRHRLPPVLRQMPRRLCEPLCIAFGTSVSSPTAPTYQLYDLPHKLKPRLYMEAREPWRVVREMKGWEQAATAEARSFLHDLLADRSAHDTFYVQLPVPGASNRCRLLQGIVVARPDAVAIEHQPTKLFSHPTHPVYMGMAKWPWNAFSRGGRALQAGPTRASAGSGAQLTFTGVQ